MKKTIGMLALALATACSEKAAPPANAANEAKTPAVSQVARSKVTNWHEKSLPNDPKEKVLARYDTNHDGVLEASELDALSERLAERRQWKRIALLEKYDANGNGTLDPAEKEAARKDRETARKAKHDRALQLFDANKDGTFDATEKAAMKEDREKKLADVRKTVLAKWDKNKNGAIDPDEEEDIRRYVDDLRKKALHPPPPPK